MKEPSLAAYFADPMQTPRPDAAALARAVARWEWFAPARIALAAATGTADPRIGIAAPWRGTSSLAMRPADPAALRAAQVDAAIERFLSRRDLRIVAEAGEPDDDVVLAPHLDDRDEVVSEQLAEIYLAQGLSDRAAEIYRKLSLLNPEKSVYFAELIRKVENNN